MRRSWHLHLCFYVLENHIPITSLHQVIQYIEQHLREELTIQEIAQQASLSPFYIQKGFAMLCGMMVGDYIHQRRLSAAGLEVLTTDRNIIDIAL